MDMNGETFEQVSMPSLRIGMFVELGMGWLAHPFPTGSFKISSAKQIEIIRGLGLEHVRVNVFKSDPAPADTGTEAAPSTDTANAATVDSAADARALAAQREQLLARAGERIGRAHSILEMLASTLDPRRGQLRRDP